MKRPFIIGIGGRSGSGKTTVVRRLYERFDKDQVTIHTMDNYYIPRDKQVRDEKDYCNFDLPDSFNKEQFYVDLTVLGRGESVFLQEYVYNNENEPRLLEIHPAPVILVEGLFIFHYQRVKHLMDLKVLIDLEFEEAFSRRLYRDQSERNYDVEEITHRYIHHAEPAYQQYIEPYKAEIDIVLTNKDSPEHCVDQLSIRIEEKLSEPF